MKPEIEISLLIDDYLNNRLDAANTIAFEERLANDKELSEKVEEHIMINEAIHFASLGQLRESIGEDLNKIPYNKANLKPWIYTGIGLLAIAGASYFFTKEKHKEIDNKEFPFKREANSKKIEPNSTVIETAPTSGSTEKIIQEKAIVNNRRNDIVKDNLIQEKPIPINTTIVDEIKLNNEKSTIIPTVSTNPVTPKEIVCNNTLNNVTTASCKQEATGSIKLNLTNKASATFELKELGKSNKNGTFTNIEAGMYTAVVKDEFNCEYTKKISVFEKWCSVNKNFSFAPIYGEKWNIVYDKEDFGKYSIFDQMNKLVKNGEFGSNNIEWDGKSNNYEALPTGLYRAIIDFADGKKEIIEITIIN